MKARILIVEDDPGHQRLIARSLKAAEADVEIEILSDGRDLLRRLAQKHFDCVLLDFRLPGMSATDLLPSIADQPHAPPIIVISSSTDQQTVISSIRRGGVDFVPKREALDSDLLWRRVQMAIATNRSKGPTQSDLLRQLEQMLHSVETDPLTGLANRYCLDRLLRHPDKTQPAQRFTAAAMLDLDFFKSVNDRYGHGAGDVVLQQVANILADACDDHEIACRWGGEEFVVLLTDRTEADVMLWAERLRNSIEAASMSYRDEEIKTTVSIGIRTRQDDEESCDERAIHDADRALYLAKHRGRNRTCHYRAVAIADQIASLREKDFSLIQKIGNLLKACKPLMGPIQRDHVTNHSREVCRVAIRIARLLKMSDPAKRSLAAAALLHDLGKIALPEELVAKPTSLTPEEAALLAQHADFSAWMAFELSGDEHTADIIRHHHSRYDGKSARQTISGEQLPLGARILNAADTFVVMKSERPYRTPTSITATSAELTNQRNLQFDPRIVDVLLESTAARTSASD